MKKIVITKSVTNWHIENVYRYMQDIYSIEQLTREEEEQLTERIRQGDESAIKRLVEANLRFVISVAKQFQGQGLTLDDLIAEGNSGLLMAARKFDNSKDIKFISYAVWWIRQAIMLAITEQCRVVKIPMNKVNNITKINRIIDKTGQKNERDLTDEEIFEQLQQEVPKITDVDFYESMNARVKAISLDSPLENNKDYDFLIDTFENNLPQYNTDYLQSRKESNNNMNRVLNTLHIIESDIIGYEFDLDSNIYRSKSEILLTYHIDEKMYEKIHERALQKLKKPLRKKLWNEEE